MGPILWQIHAGAAWVTGRLRFRLMACEEVKVGAYPVCR